MSVGSELGPSKGFHTRTLAKSELSSPTANTHDKADKHIDKFSILINSKMSFSMWVLHEVFRLQRHQCFLTNHKKSVEKKFMKYGFFRGYERKVQKREECPSLRVTEHSGTNDRNPNSRTFRHLENCSQRSEPHREESRFFAWKLYKASYNIKGTDGQACKTFFRRP